MRFASHFILALMLLAPSTASPQGMPLGPEFRVNSYTTGYQFFAAVASDGSGNFVVAWSGAGQDGSSYGVFGQRYDDTGASLGPEFRVNTFTTASQINPAVASAPSGSFVVAWDSYGQDGAESGVFGQRYDSSGAPLGPEFRVNTNTIDFQAHAAVASDSSGNFVVVWQSGYQDGSSYGIFGQRFASSGAPLGPEFRVNTFTSGLQARPSVASDPSGNFVVAWESGYQDGSNYGVFARRFASSGTALGSEFRVNTFTTNDQKYPSVASDPSGGFVVIWESSQDGSNYGIYGQRYAGGGVPLGTEFRVNTYTTSFQGYPVVTMDGGGNFAVAWESQQDGSGMGVYGQRYASSGPPLGSEFRVNTYTTGLQLLPSVAADGAGGFVVTWSSFLQDGSGAGVFGQRYGPITPVAILRFTVE